MEEREHRQAPAFDVRGVTVRLGGRSILSDVSLQVDSGELVVLLGHNGSGKTTLVKATLGLLPLAAGDVRLFGAPLASFRGWDRVGYVPQRMTATSGVPATVGEVVLSGRASRRTLGRRFVAADHSAARRALATVDLAGVEKEPVTSLSGGQQQRVLIARALARDPDVLVLDEPVASVDLAHQETFSETLRVLREGGTAVLLVAHRLGAMRPLVDRAVVLEGGRVAYDGAPGDLLEGFVEPDHHHQHARDSAPPARTTLGIGRTGV